MATTQTQTVTVPDHIDHAIAIMKRAASNPVWQSKKAWASALGFVVTVLQATGHFPGLTDASASTQVATTATMLAPIIIFVLSQAHVDAKTITAASQILTTAESVDQPDAPAAATQPAPVPAAPAAVPAAVPEPSVPPTPTQGAAK